KERLDEIDREGGFPLSDTPPDTAPDPVEVAAEEAAPAKGARSAKRRSKAAGPSPETLFEETRRAAEGAEGKAIVANVRDDDTNDRGAVAETGVRLTRSELARAAGLDDEQLGQLEEYGIVTPSMSSGDRVLFDDDALAIARAAAGFMRHGLEPRHLR